MQTELITKRTSCRVCKGKSLKKILSLGSTPPANAYVKKEDLEKPEKLFPLELYFFYPEKKKIAPYNRYCNN